MNRITTYVFYKPTVAEASYLTTTDYQQYKAEVEGMLKVPTSGEDRRKVWGKYLQCPTRVEVRIIGNYTDMPSYIEHYYTED